MYKNVTVDTRKMDILLHDAVQRRRQGYCYFTSSMVQTEQ